MCNIRKDRYTTQSDNTRVARPFIVPKKKTLQNDTKLRKDASRERPSISDASKTKKYLNMQNLYNSNFFGASTFGKLTHYDASKEENQKKIEANLQYAKDNVLNLGDALITTGLGKLFDGILPFYSKKGTIDKLSNLTPYKLGEGAEAIVIDNSPNTVGKITLATKEAMLERNTIPNTEPLRFVGYVKDGSNKFPTFILKKLKILTDKTFPKYIKKLDKAMQKEGFTKVNDPTVLYRAYTNGKIVVDDVSPDNIGVNLFGKPRLIDFSTLSVPEWLELGLSLKRGGKLFINGF